METFKHIINNNKKKIGTVIERKIESITEKDSEVDNEDSKQIMGNIRILEEMILSKNHK